MTLSSSIIIVSNSRN